MPDLICPPISDSCRPVRVGVDLLTMCGYSALYAPVFFHKPLSAVVGHVLRGDIPLGEQPFIWAGCAVVGLLSLVHGLHRVRTEGHGLKPLSFLWSAGVIAAVSWLLWLGFPATDWGWHFMRMLLLAWAASNASNIVLQLVEFWRRRPRRQYPQAQPMQGASRLLHLTTAWVEEFEGLPEHVNAPAHIAPDLLEHLGDVRLIDLAPGADGSFIPRDLPQGSAVPVWRRRR